MKQKYKTKIQNENEDCKYGGNEQVLRGGGDVPHARHLVENPVKLQLDCHLCPSVIRNANT